MAVSGASQGPYSPLISSPLNPGGHGRKTETSTSPSPPRTPTRSPERRRRLALRGDLSPTETLMRSKAALAWQSTRASRTSCGGSEVTPGRPPIHPEHWADENEDDFFGDSREDDCDFEDESDQHGTLRAWPIPSLNINLLTLGVGIGWRPSFFRTPSTRRTLLAGMLCVGGFFPAVALMSSHVSVTSVWALRQPIARALAKQVAVPDLCCP